MMKLYSWVSLYFGIFIFLPSVAIASAPRCTEVLAHVNEGRVTRVLNSKEINSAIRELASLRLELDLRKVEDPNSPVFSALDSDYSRKERELAAYLEQNQIISRAELLEKIREEISLLQNQKQAQDLRNN